MDISHLLISENTQVVEAMRVIDKNGFGVVFLQNQKNQVVASLTDGDIRRFILSAGSLDEYVHKMANYQFTYKKGERLYGTPKGRCAIPILDDNKNLLAIMQTGAEVNKCSYLPISIPVVIMAGGKGTRLYPYTQVLPKPLIPVGEKTITEYIIDKFVAFSCTDIKIIVNHKKEMIKAYFSDIQTDAKIIFIEECVPLGTGGGLALLRKQITETFFLSNCDILVDADYGEIYNYHKSHQNLLTMVCVAKTITVPYGTIVLNDSGKIAEMKEKPKYTFLTNTGFYLIEPAFLEEIAENTFIHITDVIQQCLDNGKKVGVFPISEEQWSDMGQLEELEKMRMRIQKAEHYCAIE